MRFNKTETLREIPANAMLIAWLISSYFKICLVSLAKIHEKSLLQFKIKIWQAANVDCNYKTHFTPFISTFFLSFIFLSVSNSIIFTCNTVNYISFSFHHCNVFFISQLETVFMIIIFFFFEILSFHLHSSFYFIFNL